MIHLIVNLFVQRVVGAEKFQMMGDVISIVILNCVSLMVVIVKYETLKMLFQKIKFFINTRINHNQIMCDIKKIRHAVFVL